MSENKPEIKFTAGSISAAVWKNESNINGEVKQYYTVSFERSYKDKDGNWKPTNSLRVQDIPKARLVLNKAYEYLTLRKFSSKGTNEPEIQEEVVM